MTAAIVQTAEGSTASGASAVVTAAFGSDVTAGNVIDLFFSADSSSVQSITIEKDSGTATIDTVGAAIDTVDLTASSPFRHLARYRVLVTGSGSLTMKATYGQTFHAINLGIAEISGLDGTTPFTSGKVAHAGASVATGNTVSSGLITPPSAPGIMIAWGFCVYGTAAPNAGDSATLVDKYWATYGSGGTTQCLSLIYKNYSSTSDIAGVFTAVANFSLMYSVAALFNEPTDPLPSSGSLTLSGAAPTVLVPTTVSPSAGALSFSGNAPSLTTPSQISPSVGSLSLTGYQASIPSGEVTIEGVEYIAPTGAGEYTGGTLTVPSAATAIYVFFSGGNGSSSTEITAITLASNSPGKQLNATTKANSDTSVSSIAADSIRCGIAAWRTSVVGTGSKTLSLTWANAPSDGANAADRLWNICVVYVSGGDVSSDSSLWNAGVAQAADWNLGSVANTIASVSASNGDLALVHDSGFGTLPDAPSGWNSELANPTSNSNYAARISSKTATGSYSVSSQGAAWDALTSIAISLAASGTSLQPSVGSLSISGLAPVIYNNVFIQPISASMLLTGANAILLGTIQTATGSLSLSGNSPQVVADGVIEPVSGALTFTGLQGVLQTFVSTQVGSLSISGQQAQILGDVTLQPSTATLNLSGAQPTFGGLLTVQTGSLSISGIQPIQELGVPSPIPGTLTLTGLQAALVTSLSIQPTAGSLVLSGNASQVLSGSVVKPSAAGLIITGATPNIGEQPTIQPIVGTLAMTGVVPTLTIPGFIQPTSGVIDFTGNEAILGSQILVQPATASLAINGIEPALTEQFVIEPTLGSLSISGMQPGVLASQWISATVGNIFVNGLSPALTFGVLTPQSGSLTLNGRTVSVNVYDPNSSVNGFGPGRRMRLWL